MWINQFLISQQRMIMRGETITDRLHLLRMAGLVTEKKLRYPMIKSTFKSSLRRVATIFKRFSYFLTVKRIYTTTEN